MALINCPECGKEVSDRAKTCINCGCPICEEAATTEQVIYHEEKPINKKKAVLIAATSIVAAIAIILIFVFVVAQPNKQKATFNDAIALMEKGKYTDGIDLLNTIPNYEGVSDILEEAKYESYAYSSVEAVKGILKKPDSISVYDIYFFNPLDETRDNTYPIIIMHYGAQNGFGGNSTGYVLCSYDDENEEYQLAGYSDSIDVDDLDKDDDDYFTQALCAAIMSSYFEEGVEIKDCIDESRFNTVLKNAAYSAIKIIE